MKSYGFLSITLITTTINFEAAWSGKTPVEDSLLTNSMQRGGPSSSPSNHDTNLVDAPEQDMESLCGAAKRHSENGEHHMAIERYVLALKSANAPADVCFYLAVEYQHIGETKLAEEMYLKHLSLAQSEAEKCLTYMNLGDLYKPDIQDDTVLEVHASKIRQKPLKCMNWH